MKRIWTLIAAAALLSGCATYRQADGYYVEDAPAGGTVVYRDRGGPWVDPYYNPFFGNYLPAYGDGYAPYVYGGGYGGGPVIVYMHRDDDRYSRRSGVRPGTPWQPTAHVWHAPPQVRTEARERWMKRTRPQEPRARAWQGESGRSVWRGPRPEAVRSAPARRPAQAPRRESRRRHDERH